MKYIFIFLIGSAGYSGLEVFWRGYTHWTMAVTGGACFLIIYLLNGVLRTENILLKCVAGSAVITAAELLVGVTVNLILKWNVWDYSSLPFNFMGQICLKYSLLWFFLCMPLIGICTLISRIF